MRPIVILVTLLLASPALADVVWRGDFETGDLSQWTEIQEVSHDRLQVVSDPVRQGKYALRVEVHQGDDPLNASGNRSELAWTAVGEKEGNERWYSWSTRWPDDYPESETWQLFTQWHHSGNSGSPPVEFYVFGEEMRLRCNAQTVVWTHPLERGPWHDFLFHVLWSSDPDVAYVELWYDGERVLPRTHVRNMYSGYVNYLKQGLYRSDTVEPVGVLYHDGMTVATRRDDLALPPDAGVPDAAGYTIADAAAVALADAAALADAVAGGPADAARVRPDAARPPLGKASANCAAAPGTGAAPLPIAVLLALVVTWAVTRARRE